MSVERRVAAFYDLAGADLDAARLLVAGKNRYASYHLQQAAEKLIKGLLLKRGREAGIEHRIDMLLVRLPMDDPWLARLQPLSDTTDVLKHVVLIGELIDLARSER